MSDLYGETLRIAFVERMRGERRFESVEALVDQMHATSKRSAPGSMLAFA